MVGIARAGHFKRRGAYEWTAEVGLYVTPGHVGQGVGTRLYERLFSELDAAGIRVLLALIALPNPASVALHERFGFEQTGVLPALGYKLGAWRDVGVWVSRRT